MDDTEIQARFAGLRIAIAAAIKAATRSPADLGHHIAALREIEALIPPTVHPAAKEELVGVITALARLPVRDPAGGQQQATAPALPHPDRAIADLPIDLLT